jgi:hypothetical protein
MQIWVAVDEPVGSFALTRLVQVAGLVGDGVIGNNIHGMVVVSISSSSVVADFNFSFNQQEK